MPRKKKDKFKGEPPLPGFSYSENFDQVYQQYKEVGAALESMINTGPALLDMENEFELGQEIAVALKQDLRDSEMSREEFCDRVNEFLGRTPERYNHEPRLCRKPLAKTTLDKMISNPNDYPIDCYYLYAFQHILGFGVMNTILGAVRARVVSGEDLRKIAVVKAQEFREKAQALEKNIGRM